MLNSYFQATTPLPLLAYIHVPKTAGSTVNSVLDLCSPHGVSHCEAIFYMEDFVDRASAYDWLSGHISRDEFGGKLHWLKRPVEYFASIREPATQLLSHLNWSFEILDRGVELFLTHPIEVQQIFAEVQATDFSDLASVMRLLLRTPNGVFLNCQARHILGADFEAISDREIVRRVQSYCYIATEETLPTLYEAFRIRRNPTRRLSPPGKCRL